MIITIKFYILNFQIYISVKRVFEILCISFIQYLFLQDSHFPNIANYPCTWKIKCLQQNLNVFHANVRNKTDLNFYQKNQCRANYCLGFGQAGPPRKHKRNWEISFEMNTREYSYVTIVLAISLTNLDYPRIYIVGPFL